MDVVAQDRRRHRPGRVYLHVAQGAAEHRCLSVGLAYHGSGIPDDALIVDKEHPEPGDVDGDKAFGTLPANPAQPFQRQTDLINTGLHRYGSKTYKLHLPPNIPVKDIWSVIIYDTQPRTMLQTDQQFAGNNSYGEGLKENKDGSIDIYFSPKPRKGMENNWIQTIPGKGWFIILRLYGPLEPWLDQTWRPSELDLVK